MTVLAGAPSAGTRLPGLWAATWKLLRLQLRIWFNAFRRGRLGRKIAQVILLLLVVGVMAFVFAMTRLVLDFLQSPTFLSVMPDLPDFAGSLPVMLLGASFFGILLTSFGVLLQALYLAGDMDFLLSAPVPIRAVFLSKLLQAILPNFGFIGVLTLPLLFGLGSAQGYNVLYYPLVVIVIGALTLAAAAIAGILVMGVVHFFPARRAAEILGFLGAILAIVCSQSGQFVDDAELTNVQFRQAALVLTRFDLPWSPVTWAGRGLVEIGQGHFWPGVPLFVAALLLVVGIFAGSLIVAERLYYSGWASVGVVGGPKRKAAARRAAPRRTRAASVWQAIVVKDFAVLRRDLRNLSQMVTPIIMGVIYAILLVRGRGDTVVDSGNAPAFVREGFEGLLVFANIGISLFVGWILSARLGATAFSHEGRSYWVLKTAPIGPGQMLLAKYTVAFLPVTVLGGSFLLILSLLRGVPIADVIYGLLAVTLCYAAITGVNLAFGVIGAVFDWEDPRRMMRGSVGCLSPMASMATVGVCLLFFGGPVVAAGMLGLSDLTGKLVGLLLGGVASAACAVIPVYLVRSRVPRLADDL